MEIDRVVSHSKEFDGDIIITDPCYLRRNDDDDFDYCDSDYLKSAGIENCIVRDTLYGDWGCTTFNTDTKEAIGKFCADSGMVCVAYLDEVLIYNPDFDYHVSRPWTTTLIKDFNGVVEFVVVHEAGEYNEDSKYWKKGDKLDDKYVIVVGTGVNKNTGTPINFVGKQTSL